MEKVSLREYAKRKKLSYFDVMKLVRNGKVQSETVEENGKDVPYILLEDEVEQVVNEGVVEVNSETMTAEEENVLLKEEIIKLKEALERCNKRTILA